MPNLRDKVCKNCESAFRGRRDRIYCSPECRHAALSGPGSNLYKHGNVSTHSPTPEYRAWLAMQQRCYYGKSKVYHNYGGRGIRVAEEWRGEGGFERFLERVGPKPTPQHTLDRYPDNNGNYEPGNVRWATHVEQSANRRPRTRHPKSHCPQGHEYTPENSAVYGNDYRRCRTCAREREQDKRDRRKAMAA